MAGNRGGRHGEITGQVGTPPPPGAPIETAQPITPEMQQQMERAARANEQVLPELKAQPQGDVTDAAVRARELDALMGGTKRARPPITPTPTQQATTQPAPSGIILTDADADADAPDVADAAPAAAPPVVEAPPVADAPPPPADIPRVIVPPVVEGSKLAAAARAANDARIRTSQPAASNTDSPSRGIPTQQTDPGKQITGGFGAAADQQYFPLDGSELREVVLGLMDKLAAQLTNDLRFSPALCYPRVRARVIVSIDCYAKEMSFELPKAADHLKTPLAVAIAQGAEPGEMEIEAGVGEYAEDGGTETSTNKMRRDLGLEVPMKQRIQTPTGFATIDRRG